MQWETTSAQALRARTKLCRALAAAAAESPGPGAVSRWHLFDVGFTRDCWMHRTDLAMATGRAFDADPEHDGRILADIVAVHLRARRTDDYDRRLTRGLADAG